MLQRLLNTLYAAGMVIAATSLSLICLLIVAQIVGRWSNKGAWGKRRRRH